MYTYTLVKASIVINKLLLRIVCLTSPEVRGTAIDTFNAFIANNSVFV